MKKHILILSFLYLASLSIDAQIDVRHNAPRIGDAIIKQQVEYIAPGKNGSGVVWNFSKLKTINDEYKLEYSAPPMMGDSVYVMGNNRLKSSDYRYGELLVGTEHETMYYYRLKNDSLSLIGYENAAVKFDFNEKKLEQKYPLSVGQLVQSTYKGSGLYAKSNKMTSDGRMQTKIDAYGDLITPTGDTLSPVIRVQILQSIGEPGNDKSQELHTYRWYTKGYRYPVFESTRAFNAKDSTEIFATSFFYPPQEHLYLDTDPDNLALLEKLWDVESLFDRDLFAKDNFVVDDKSYSYQVYPNPVKNVLNVDYVLKDDASVNILLYGMDGRVARNIHRVNQSEGAYSEAIDCSNLVGGSYVLKLVRGKEVVNVKVVKR